MTTDPHGRRSVILECGCAKYFPMPYPLRGERTYCGLKPRHGWTRIKYGPSVYRSRCQNCSAGRRHGASLPLAMQHISAHLRSRPHHTMQLIDGLLIVEKISGVPVQETLDDVAPF